MYSQGNFNPQAGQGPQAPRPPPYIQHPSIRPALSNNFQQGPLLPSPQVPPHFPIYQHGPMGQHFASRPVPPGGMPNSGQPYLLPPPPPPPPPTIQGSAPLPRMYPTAQQNIQHSSYVAPGSAPPPPVSSNSDMLQAVPPIPYQGSIFRTPPHQLGGAQGLHQIPSPPPALLTNNFSRFAQYVSSLDSAVGNSQTTPMAPPIPLPPPPPPPPASSSPLPVPPCSPPPVSSSAPVSMPLSTDSPSGSNAVDSLDENDLSSQRIMTSINPPPKPKGEKIIGKIEELCQLISRNGPSYEDFVRQKESMNPEYAFLFGGESGSEAAIAHGYFLWMKTQSHLDCEVNGMALNMTNNNLAIATKPDASADSDMEMEDDITGSEIDQAVSHPIEDGHQATGSIRIRFEAKEHVHILSRSTGADASMISSALGEQGLKIVSSVDDESLGRSGFGVEGPVNIPEGDAKFPFSSYKEDSSKSITGAKSLLMEEEAIADIMSPDKYSGEATEGRSPIRLLQDYESDESSQNDEDPCLEDANPERVLKLGASGDNRGTGLNLKVDSDFNRPCKTKKGIKPLSESCLPLIAPNAEPTSVACESSSEHIEFKHKSYSSIASPEARLKEKVSACPSASVAFSNKFEKNNIDKESRLPSKAQKIDKFGRLVRDGASDSDSDDSHHTQRRRKRGRSRSKSPLDRRRRSPRRRREKRSRSRSWSPRNQRSRSRSPRNRRSRSRSPSFRHAGGYNSNRNRRDRGQIPECFDFSRGKCYRGASCRFMHHGSEKIEGSSHHKSKQPRAQLTPGSKNHDSHDDYVKISTTASYHKQETIKQEVEHNHDTSVNHATEVDINIHNTEDTHSISVVESENLRAVAAEMPQSKIVQERQIDVKSVHGTLHGVMDPHQVSPSKLECEFSVVTSHAEASKGELSSSENLIEQSQIIVSDPVLVSAENTAQETDGSSPNQISQTSPNKLCVGDTLTNVDSMHNSTQLPPFPTSGPNVESNNALQIMTQHPRDYNLISQTATNQSQPASLESYPSYMYPNKSSLFSVTSAASLPPPPLPLPPHIPALNSGTATIGVPQQFQQSGLLPRSDFGTQMLRPYSVGNSQFSNFQHQSYPPVHESHQSISHPEDYRFTPLSGSNLSDSRFGVSGISGEDFSKRLPVQGLSASNAFSQSSHYLQPTYSSQELLANNLPSGEIPKTSQIHPHLQQQQLPYDLHHSVQDSAYGVPGKLSTAARYPADLDRNQPLHLPYFGVTRSSTHFNPYASTFEKPLSSRFSSNVFMPEKDPTYSNKHNHPLSLSHVSVDEPGVRSRHGISPPFSSRGVGRVLPRAGEDQYDPLFDSIEPSSNSYKKSDHIQKWEPPGSSDIVPKLIESSLPLDVEENNKKKDFSDIAFATSPDIEDVGETADAEVADVGTGSQSDPDALENTDMGEMEIDQMKSYGKSKKSKESRSMKLFKVCLADFVKEVLKPSWRQGNMSKEAFKTVVKKTVDKVSGAMKSRQVPKSKAKINQYIDSSQRKLTKLVMGYVDKYAKG